MWHLIDIILSAIGGIGVIVVAIATWIGKASLSRYIESVRHNNAVEIERLRQEMARNNKFVETALTVMSQTRNVVTEKQLNAIEKLWRAMGRIGAELSLITTLHGILLRDEYATAMNNPRLRQTIQEVNEEEVVGLVADIMKEVHECRLYVSDDVWNSFQLWHHLHGRVMIDFFQNRKNNEFLPWQDDPIIQRYVLASLNDEERAYVQERPIGELGRLIFVLQQRFLNGAAGMISGMEAARSQLSQAHLLMDEYESKRKELLGK
ncbi:MAG: hypothetical protein K6T83_22095 [Alicyclobacillus sp.]|nr:hypothetical protein [Alicyclobacillus sp.]